jgi:hypothetical protein
MACAKGRTTSSTGMVNGIEFYATSKAKSQRRGHGGLIEELIVHTQLVT